ncbi:hypothetical protein ERICII_02368 [Paenibacillus larvae subsp. larvae DSM 25430]|uniref:MarR family transcriptional regulator n=2 Tax=Paenibacillus larvae TaxID=1464 RepID=V9W7S6_9BACL|nr:hypothetical protein [Paenibacillus larvae]AHD06198.1 hypothetical protein ERIC2_c24070 [Paenibacillus larvae subsp. larvae DSM 25430]AVG12735.1 hypothetical protein ERICII_02368 [Paenibacillus larvae subsp. larvae DSM 25430]MDR5569257.1 hypothetical protein [Paenibacillus larvae]MDR5596458.1 hypothetical protein [Paenibacillus larvae]MDR5596470.1 hypothetical protein [Paenibacillus larvae]
MLSDLERKTLRILYNFSKLNRRMPNIKELEKKTGAREVNIFNALDGLQKQGYIEWQRRDTQSIKIITAWEEQLKEEPLRKYLKALFIAHELKKNNGGIEPKLAQNRHFLD